MPETPAMQQVLNILVDVQHQVTEIHGRLAGTIKEIYTIDDVASLTGRAAYTVRNWIREGRICAERVTGSGPRGRLLIRRAELGKLVRLGSAGDMPAVSLDLGSDQASA